MWKNLLSGKKKLVKKVEFLEVNSVAENSDDSFDGSSGDGSDTCGLYVVNGRPESEKEESLEFQSSKTALKQKIDVDLRITSLPRIRWQEKYEFLLSLVSDPRFLVKDALKAEQAKLTLKSQAFLLEKSIVTDAFSKCQLNFNQAEVDNINANLMQDIQKKGTEEVSAVNDGINIAVNSVNCGNFRLETLKVFSLLCQRSMIRSRLNTLVNLKKVNVANDSVSSSIFIQNHQSVNINSL
ncbi:hypothetical protein QYM36_003635 [Artemia franciscana]|uniref:Uncharacterized protein n=1 Tax=Artemia franciscana TaxID=6661 RepID=A0AA88I565_ARTSF|nr:hypothetical protein QYM36_003635 [Artemia franciscana]